MKQRKHIRTVKQFTKVRGSILNYLANRHDENAREIIDRIENVSDSAASGARYHVACFITLKDPYRTIKREKREIKRTGPDEPGPSKRIRIA